MPGVKSLHQQSGSNSKPEHIMGHSLQAVSLLVKGVGGHVTAIPLASRIHEGVVFSNRDQRTLLDKLVILLTSIIKTWDRQVVLVADAYYASGKIIKALLAKLLLTCLKNTKCQPDVYYSIAKNSDIHADVLARNPALGATQVNHAVGEINERLMLRFFENVF